MRAHGNSAARFVQRSRSVADAARINRSGAAADDPVYDRLTDKGRSQALTVGWRLFAVRPSVTAVVSAAEARTRDTALAITMVCMLPTASVDGALTSKAYDNETPAERAARGIAAVRRFLDATHGDVVIVSHGHLINLMGASLTGGAFTKEVVQYELVNTGILKMSVTGSGSSAKWVKLESDAMVHDD